MHKTPSFSGCAAIMVTDIAVAGLQGKTNETAVSVCTGTRAADTGRGSCYGLRPAGLQKQQRSAEDDARGAPEASAPPSGEDSRADQYESQSYAKKHAKEKSAAPETEFGEYGWCRPARDRSTTARDRERRTGRCAGWEAA